MEKTKKRTLVTGGAGFLGSHLCESLLAHGHTVFCLDNFSTGSWDNIQSFCTHPEFHVLERDVALPLHLEVDSIYNLACPASPIHYQRDPIQTTETSILGALQMLRLACATKAVIFQASTSEVYGDPQVHPQPEDYWGHVNPIGLRACYDESKRCAETLFFDFHRQYGLNIKVARIFNTYGPRMQLNDGRVVSNFIVQALQNLPITLYGDGRQTRSFCFVSDMIAGFMRLMESSRSLTGPVNLGNPTEYTMLELAETIVEMTCSKSQLEFCKLPSDDPKKRKPSIELAENALDWRPKIDLKTGLRQTIAYFEKTLQCTTLK